MTKILIDRSTVEQALRHVVRQAQENLVPTIHYGPVHDITNRLEAALAEPVEEPVAYIHRQGNHWEVSERELVDDERARGWTEEPLYTAPPQRKPLTEEEIDGLMQSIGLRCADDGNERMANHAEWERRQRRRIARAVEQAHGI